MRTPFILLFLPLLAHTSALGHDNHLARRNHSHLVHRANNIPVDKQRCAPRRKPKSTSTNKGNESSNNNNSGSSSGLLLLSSSCGESGATSEVKATSGPNGSQRWLNCGLDQPSGWNPPYVTVSQLKVVDLADALQSSNSPFHACQDYLHLFEKYGGQYGVPPILIASFAMQESSCNPETIGGGGEQGLMQITQDKCGGAPDGNCRDPDYNIKTGAKFFADTLSDNGGDVLLSIGMYNGWHKSMTIKQATAAQYTKCCRCQNNLDYLQQFVNGWLQNVNVYGTGVRIGKYFNLDVCHG